MKQELRMGFLTAVAALCFAGFSTIHAQEAEQRTSVARLPADVKQSINRGLALFASSQNSDGSWGASHRSGGTALGLMSFMLQGHVPGEGEHGEAMNKAIDFLISVQKGGYFHDPSDRGMYEHGLALLALSEAWGQSKDPRIRRALINGVNATVNAQNHEGGWRYTPRPTSADTSCSAMQIVALASAREAGIAVPAKTMQRAAEYLFSCEVRASGGFAYQRVSGAPLGGGGFARTAACTLALMLCGEHQHPATRGGVAFLSGTPDAGFEGSDPTFHYGQYYAVQAMYQAGDDAFNKWYPRVSKALLASQHENGGWGQDKNSFSAIDTGFVILTLGVPYRFLPIYQK